MTDDSLAASCNTEAFRRRKEALKSRLAYGATQRHKLQMQLEAGVVPTGTRPRFLDEVSTEVLKLLFAAADRFTLDHPDDAASIADLMDVIATARVKLIQATKSREGIEADKSRPEEANTTTCDSHGPSGSGR